MHLAQNDTEAERIRASVNQTIAGCWTRPFGSETGFADDHLHIDLGYVTVAPRGISELCDNADAGGGE